jgi:pyruvate/2-oxoglutarate dehydrogenase complex dihydrolipoamide dehydrogenase (E3) component
VDGKEEDTAWAFDWGRMMASKNRELNRLEGVYRNLLTKANVDLMEGRGVLLDPHTVQIGGSGGKTVTAERILVAAGGWPQLPQIPGIGASSLSAVCVVCRVCAVCVVCVVCHARVCG